MKKLFAGSLCLLLGVGAAAQQRPHYTQYVLNQYIINPAITGIENYTDVKISHRHQWVGFEDAPVTTYFSIHKPIGKKDYRTTPTSLSVDGENPRGSSYWENYTAAEPHHGIGFQVISDRTGPINYLTGYVTYAYHIGLTAQTSLSAGIGVGASRIGLDGSKLDISRVDPAVYTTNVINNIRPDVMAGLYLYAVNYFIGISAQQIIPQKIDFSNGQLMTKQGRTVPHLFGVAGYRLTMGDDFNLLPSVMVKYINPVPAQFEFNAKLQYRDFAWLGGSYRKDNGFAAMAGLNISNKFNIGYAFDYTTSGMNTFSRGTHELLLGFTLGNGFGDTCPRNVW
jgi:type IX secretion system PorP/SprF family membrane protein